MLSCELAVLCRRVTYTAFLDRAPHLFFAAISLHLEVNMQRGTNKILMPYISSYQLLNMLVVVVWLC